MGTVPVPSQRSEARVSVIVPLYNAEKYARRILSEICMQSYKRLEIILIDDGSTDGTRKICTSLAGQDARVRYIFQENAGVGAARNRGLEVATANFVMFVDADDELDPDFVERLLFPLEKQDVSMSVADIENINAEGGVRSLSLIRLPYGVIDTAADPGIISKVRTFCWGKIYRKSLWEENGIRFPEGELYRTMPGFEDVCCLPLLAARAGKIAHVGGTHYHYYRGHEGGLMHSAKFGFFLNAQRELLRRFAKAGLAAEFHGSLRQFIIGQLVSANRWQLTAEEVEELWDFLLEYFPELAFLRGKSIYVPLGWQRDVLRHVFFDKCVMTDKPQQGSMDFSIQGFAQGLASEYETFCYDMADRMIDNLPDIGEVIRRKMYETAQGYGYHRD